MIQQTNQYYKNVKKFKEIIEHDVIAKIQALKQT